MTTFVLVHGAVHTGACWGRMTPHLDHPFVAVDLPGRGRRPADVRGLCVDDFVDAIVEDIEAIPDGPIVLVGHSLAGLSLPRVAERVPERLERLVFVASSVPPDGQNTLGVIREEFQSTASAYQAESEPMVLDADAAIGMFCNDMDEDQIRFVLDGLVPEAPGPIVEPSRLDGLRNGVPATWLRLLRDTTVTKDRQDFFIQTIRDITPIDVIDMDAGHNAFVSQPEAFAAILNGLVAKD